MREKELERARVTRAAEREFGRELVQEALADLLEVEETPTPQRLSQECSILKAVADLAATRPPQTVRQPLRPVPQGLPPRAKHPHGPTPEFPRKATQPARRPRYQPEDELDHMEAESNDH